MLNKGKNFLVALGMVSALWLLSAWFIADGVVMSDLRENIRHDQEELDTKADYLAGNIKQHLHHLQNVPQLTAKEFNIINVLHSVANGLPEFSAERRKEIWSEQSLLKATNKHLASLAGYMSAGVIYVLNPSGVCVLSSNADKQDSFIGSDFSSREYFKTAIAGGNGYQYAIGKVSKVPGLYFSSPILERGKVIGVAAVKISLSDLSQWVDQANAYLSDEYGVVVLAHDKNLEMRILPDSSIGSLSMEDRLQRYKRSDFSLLDIRQWPRPELTALRYFAHDRQPLLLVSRNMQQTLGIHVTQLVPKAAEYSRNRVQLFLLLALVGILFLFLAMWRWIMVRNRMLAKKEIENSERRLNKAQSIAHLGSYEWDLATGGLTWSDEHFRLWGIAPGSAAPDYKLFRQGIHPEDVERIENIVRQALQEQTGYECEHRVAWPDGSVHDIYAHGDVIYDEAGRAVLMVGTVQDITGRKQQEKNQLASRIILELIAAGHGLEEIFNSIIDLAESVTITGIASIHMVDTEKRRLHHAAAPHLPTACSAMLDGVEYGASVGPFGTVAASGQELIVADIMSHADWENYKKAAIEAGLRACWSVPATDESGQVVAIITVYYREVRSPSEYELDQVRVAASLLAIAILRQKKEDELVCTREEAVSASNAKSDFLANMSHEIRTPMNAIIGFSHLCLETRLEPLQRDYLEKVEQSANLLLGIINDILDFSKIESGKLDMEKQSFRLDEVISDVVAVNSVHAEKKGLEFLVDHGMDIPNLLLGDALRLRQVLSNLVGNAVKFTKAGEVMLQVKVQSQAAQQLILRFTVSDTGIGMTDGQIGKLFQSFSQGDTSTSRKYGGTGLGLAISKRLVELMDGKIWAESVSGHGSRFMFELPFERASQEQHAELHSLAAFKVLVVDKNESARRLLLNYLQSFGVTAVAVESGNEADAALRLADTQQLPFTDVLLDWNLPGMSSLKLAKGIRHDMQLSRRPRVICLAGYAPNQMLMEAVNGNLLDSLLNKPVTASRLYDALLTSYQHIVKLPEIKTESLHSASLAGLQVLLVEDNAVNQQLANALLSRAGVKVSLASDGFEALQVLQHKEFDAVLMDIQMPKIDGLEATRQIRLNPAYANLPIIALTANAMSGDREQYLAAGMNDYISKPIDCEKMYATIGRWVRPKALLPEQEACRQAETAAPQVLEAEKALAGMGGDEKIYLLVLENFISNQGGAVQAMTEALATADTKTAKRLAHTLKGLAATIGAAALAEFARQLELAINQGDAGQCMQLLESTKTEMIRVLDEISIYKRKYESIAVHTISASATDEIKLLMERLDGELHDFDSQASDTMGKIRKLLKPTASWPRFVKLDHYVSAYDYENAMLEMKRLNTYKYE